ncbi:MAG: 3-coathanger stack domain-containing protein [Ferruginibacter sp.]
MLYKIKIITAFLLIVCFSATLFSQVTTKGISKAVMGKTNFTEVAKYELIHPAERLAKKPEMEDEDIKTIPLPVDQSTPPFGGKLTNIDVAPGINKPAAPLEFPCVNFRALDDNGVTDPPDVNGAIGFDHIMTTLNTQISIQTKQGGNISTTSLTGFWNGLGGHTDIFDPKITYDPYDRRWIFVCSATRDNANSALLLAVSETPDPTLGWTTYTFDVDPGDQLWLDYPSLGFNRNWITVSGNLFNITGITIPNRGRIWAISKADVYAGLPNITAPFFERTDYFSISPANTYDANDNTQWCVSRHNPNSNNNGFVRLISITGAQAAPVFTLGAIVNTGPAWSSNSEVVGGPQLTSAAFIDLGDDRLLQSTFRNGLLWYGHNIFLPADNPTTCAAEIVSINTLTGLSTENIRTAVDANNMTAYPSITVNRNNDIFFGYTSFSASAYPRATVSYRRSGQGFFFYYYKDGEDWYVKLVNGDNRWGDYSATFIDPEDDVTAWTIQEYSRPRVGGITSAWGTWWAKICPGSCTDDYFLFAPQDNLMKKFEANGTITSIAKIQINSSIKYDAGTKIILSPGFKAARGVRFRAYIEGCGGTR